MDVAERLGVAVDHEVGPRRLEQRRAPIGRRAFARIGAGELLEVLDRLVVLLGRVEDAAERQVGQLLGLLERLRNLVRIVVLLDLAQDRLERVGGELAVILADVGQPSKNLALG